MVSIALSCIAVIFAVSVVSLAFVTPESRRRAIVKLPDAKQAQAKMLGKQEQAALHREKELANRVGKAPVGRARLVGYYAPWEEAGVSSLRAHQGNLTDVVAAWLTLSPDGLKINTDAFDPIDDKHTADVMNICRRSGIRLHALISNAQTGKFDAGRVEHLLINPGAQADLAASLVKLCQKQGFAGVQIDFENLPPEDADKLTAFFAVVHEAFKKAGLELSASLEADQDAHFIDQIADHVDWLVGMFYDAHDESSEPGPIAPLDWFESKLEKFLKVVPESKLVAGVGTYGYDWNRTKGTAESISFQEAMIAASGYLDSEAAAEAVSFDGSAMNPHFAYSDDDGAKHEVWFLDAVTTHNAMISIKESKILGTALWVLGSEDPSLWNSLGASSSALREIQFPYEVNLQGRGEILSVIGKPQTGLRDVQVEPNSQLIVDEVYRSYATPYLLERSGYRDKTVVLTFDDGPDPTYTPQILDALRDLGVPATFFAIGENMERNPGLVHRIIAEGHDIGSHTFTHPDLGSVSTARVKLELNATQRSLQAILGRSTRLFRPPYNADAEPGSIEEVAPVLVADQLGYKTIGESVDPEDWMLRDDSGRERTVDEMEQIVLRQLAEGRGNMVLLHDGGGDRSKSVELVKRLVPKLRAEGYRFATVSEVAGMSMEESMPPVTGRDLALVGLDRLAFTLVFGGEWLMVIAFLVAIGLGLARVLLTIPLAFAFDRRESKAIYNPDFRPSVTVLIAAYNEAAVIDRTIHSVLGSTYPIAQVLIVDDGSTDGTADVVRREFGDQPNVQVVSQPNGGKASALNRGIEMARGEFLVCIDGDTQIDPGAIGYLVRHFEQSDVGAVAGNVRVGNLDTPITIWQSVEYTTSQNLDRRAYALLNAVVVVPGAIGAWRKSALQAVGGLRTDTLAEDMDLTWRLRMAGWRITTESAALAFTEAPSTVRAFFKQRFRWAFGTLQCLWKHRRVVGRCGWFGRLIIPMLWVFQICFQLLAPLVDLKLLWSLGAALWTLVRPGPHEVSSGAWDSLAQVAVLYGLFFLVELIGGWLAYRLDRQKPWPLAWLFLQRFVYRQVIYAVIVRSLVRAVGGARQGWGKLERLGTVSQSSGSDQQNYQK